MRLPAASGVLNGVDVELFHLSAKNVQAIDAQMTGIDYGYVTIRLAKGRIAGFDALRSTKVLDDLVGQPPREAAA